MIILLEPVGQTVTTEVQGSLIVCLDWLHDDYQLFWWTAGPLMARVDQMTTAVASTFGDLLKSAFDIEYRLLDADLLRLLRRDELWWRPQIWPCSSSISKMDGILNGLIEPGGHVSIARSVSAAVVDSSLILRMLYSSTALSIIFPTGFETGTKGPTLGSTDYTIFSTTFLVWTRLHISALDTIGARSDGVTLLVLVQRRRA